MEWLPRKRTLLVLGLFIVAGAIINVAVAWGCALWSTYQAQYYGNSATVIAYENRSVENDPRRLWALTKDVRISGLRLRVYVSADGFSVLEDFVHYSLIANSDLAAICGEAALTCSSEGDLDEFVTGPQHQRMQAALRRAELLPSVQQVAQELKARIAAVNIPSTVHIPGESSALPPRIYTIYMLDAGWPFRAFEGINIVRAATRASPGQSRTINAANIADLFSPAGQPRLIPYGSLWPGFTINTIFYAAMLWLLLAFPFKLRRWRRIKRGLCPACAYPVGTSAICTECGTWLHTI